MNSATIELGEIASARSGDKGNHVNIAVVARRSAAYRYLAEALTTERVGEFFSDLGATHIERFELPKLGALNFVIHDALAGGASRSLRIDSQGKLLGTALLGLTLPAPDNLSDMVAIND